MSIFVQQIIFTVFFNPNYALDFVMKTQNAIKISAHGLFLKKEYFCILNLKIGVSAYF